MESLVRYGYGNLTLQLKNELTRLAHAAMKAMAKEEYPSLQTIYEHHESLEDSLFSTHSLLYTPPAPPLCLPGVCRILNPYFHDEQNCHGWRAASIPFSQQKQSCNLLQASTITDRQHQSWNKIKDYFERICGNLPACSMLTYIKLKAKAAKQKFALNRSWKFLSNHQNDC